MATNVTVSHRLPYGYGPQDPVGLTGPEGRGNWASLVEKAMVVSNDKRHAAVRKFGYGEFHGVDFAYVARALLKDPQVSLQLSRYVSLAQLSSMLAQDAVIVVSAVPKVSDIFAAMRGSHGQATALQQGNEVVRRHAYAVLAANESSGLITVRNPWGFASNWRYREYGWHTPEACFAAGYLPNGRMLITEHDFQYAFDIVHIAVGRT